MRFIIIILVAITFCGCTVPVNFYIQNASSSIITVVAHLKSESLESYNLKYKKGLSDLKFNLVDKLNEELKPKRVDGQYLHFELPAMSTFFIGSGMNFKNFTFDELEINLPSGEMIYLTWSNQELLQKGKNFGNKHFAWYTIE